jgi:arylformamidase
VGCHTLAIDAAASSENPAHYALLGSEVYIIDNLKNLDRLPPFCLFLALPLKIKGGSGSPVRPSRSLRQDRSATDSGVR